MKIETIATLIQIGCVAFLAGIVAWLIPTKKFATRVLIFVACAIALFGASEFNTRQERKQAARYERYRALHVNQDEMTAFACGVLRARNEAALTDGCDKFKDLRP